MRAISPGLLNAIDAVDKKPGSEDAKQDAACLANQAAGIALVCSLALDSLTDGRDDCDPIDVIGITSRLMFKCWDDLTVAVNLMD